MWGYSDNLCFKSWKSQRLTWRRNQIIALRGGGKVRFRLSQHLSILLYIAGEPQKLDRQKYISLNCLFIHFSKIQLSDTSEVLVKLYPDNYAFRIEIYLLLQFLTNE